MTIDPAAFHEFEHAGGERAAEYYADVFGGVTTQMAAPLLDAVGADAGTRLLDVATGPGFVAAAAAARGAAAVDRSGRIAAARAARRAFVVREVECHAAR